MTFCVKMLTVVSGASRVKADMCKNKVQWRDWSIFPNIKELPTSSGRCSWARLRPSLTFLPGETLLLLTYLGVPGLMREL